MPTRNCSWASLLRSRRETNDACVFIYSRYSSTGGSGSGAEKVDEQTSKKVQPKTFDLTFEEYQKLRRKLRTRQRIAGLPVGALALVTSSAVSAYLNPNMFDAAPEQIQPIMYVLAVLEHVTSGTRASIGEEMMLGGGGGGGLE